MATLVLQLQDGLKQFDLRDGVTLGRSRLADLRVEHATISRQHARFNVGDDGVWVEDLGGANGTKVNGVTVRGMPEPLADGTSVRFGFVSGWVFTEAAPETLGQGGGSGGKAATCSVCSWDVEAGQAMVRCATCGATYHGDCWAENHGCATYGCAGAGGPAEEEPAVEKPVVAAGPGLPMGHLMLAGSLVAALAGLVSFGAPAAGMAAVSATRVRGGEAVDLAALALAGVGVLAGVGTSLVWWGWL